jgi:hypothetical protein
MLLPPYTTAYMRTLLAADDEDALAALAHFLRTFDYPVSIARLAAGADIVNQPVYSPNVTAKLTYLKLLTQGAPAGIDDGNTAVLTLRNNSGDTVATVTYNTANQPPSSGMDDLTSGIVTAQATIANDEFLTLSLTQGTTARMPAGVLILGVTIP